MAKDPAFLFYPGDWLGGTLGMTFEEKGAYIELLMLQFNRGHMEGHMIGQVVGQLWDKISHKFVQDKKGLWYNVRLEIEQNKRKYFTNSRKNNLKGKNQYTKTNGHMDGHMTSHMENENEIIDINTNAVVFFIGSKIEKNTPAKYIAANYSQLVESYILSFGNGKVKPQQLYAEFDRIYPVQSSFTNDNHLQNCIRKLVKQMAEKPAEVHKRKVHSSIV